MKNEPAKGIHYINLGPWPVFLGFTQSEKAFKKEMKRLHIEDVSFTVNDHSAAALHLFERPGKPMLMILAIRPAGRKISKEQYAALIAHEAVHALQFMQENLARSKSLGQEADAYLVQQIVQECLQIAWKTGKRRAIHD